MLKPIVFLAFGIGVRHAVNQRPLTDHDIFARDCAANDLDPRGGSGGLKRSAVGHCFLLGTFEYQRDRLFGRPILDRRPAPLGDLITVDSELQLYVLAFLGSKTGNFRFHFAVSECGEGQHHQHH